MLEVPKSRSPEVSKSRSADVPRMTMQRCVAGVMLALAVSVPSRADEQLGRISFPTSGSAAAQPLFIRGVLLMHSFEFDDAAQAFRQARAADPAFAMAYWGEALTHNHPLWRYQDRDAALKVLAELGPTPEDRRAKAPTPREQAYLGTLDVLYGEGPKADRDRAYAAALGALSKAYPDDDEARTLHALAILGTNVERRDFSVDMRAAALVEDVFMRNQEHPGALHYMIHAYDNPMHAPLGLRAASRYGRIAQQAAHALHMTSHIFFALGQWDDSIAANEASWAASRARVEKKGLGPADHGYHAYLWLSYAYLQQGRIDDARRIVDDMARLLAQAPVRVVAYHYAAARAAWIIDSERWTDLPAPADAERSGVAFGEGGEPVCRRPGRGTAGRSRRRRAGKTRGRSPQADERVWRVAPRHERALARRPRGRWRHRHAAGGSRDADRRRQGSRH